MSLDKAIDHKKEHRKKYYKSKAIDRTCRNNGTCGYCKDNRLYKRKLQETIANEKIEEYYSE